MRTIPLVLITFVALSLSPTAARAGANGSWCANYGTGLWEGRDLEFDADEPRSLLPNRAIDPLNRTRPPRGTSTRGGSPQPNSISPLIPV
jgi:hypothetical protein